MVPRRFLGGSSELLGVSSEVPSPLGSKGLGVLLIGRDGFCHDQKYRDFSDTA